MIVSTLIAAALAAGPMEPREPPVMRVQAVGLNLSDPGDAARFADRVAEQSRRFCGLHIEWITPEHPTDPRLCERGMAEAAVRALPDTHLRRFREAGGPALVYRRLR